MSNIFKKIGRGLSKGTAAVVEGIAGTLIGILVFNPAAETIKILRSLLGYINFSRLVEWLNAPLIFPLKDILKEGFAQQTQNGWDEGFDWDIKARSRLAYYIQFRSDFIASLIIMGLITVAILAIFFPATFGIAALLPNIIAAVGLKSLAPWALAVVVGFTGTLILSLFYTIGSVWFYDGFVLPDVLPGLGHKRNIFSRIAGAIVGAVWGTLSALVVYNPVTVLIDNCRRFWQKKDLPYLMQILLTPVDIISGILQLGFAFQADMGWVNGFQSAFHTHQSVYNGACFAGRDIIAGWVITGLVTLAVLAVLFPATFGVAAILPTMVAAVGLSGLSTVALAAIAGVASLIVLMIAYGISTAVYDYQPASNTHIETNLRDVAASVERRAEEIADSTAQAMQQLKADVKRTSKADDGDCLASVSHGFKRVFSCLCPCMSRSREEKDDQQERLTAKSNKF